MMELGCCDIDISAGARDSYLKQVEEITRLPMAAVANNRDKLTFRSYTPDAAQPMSVRQVQEALIRIGFFPGGMPDAILGYRTLSAIRLFQEYVRTVEKHPCTPDGLFGPESQKHLTRWLESGQKSEWEPAIASWKAGTLGSSEFTQWLALLNSVKEKYTSHPNRTLQLVNDFDGATDTRKVAQWDFDPGKVHLIGIRRAEASGKFDDVFVLLIKGMVLKFQGSTEPGASSHPRGTPFLVQGQHDYHFGWHKKMYLALRPQNNGVLVVRSKGDKRLDDRDLDNGLEANATINIHWGGKGGKFDVSTWSEGCQVINGTLYVNKDNELIDCSAFVATNNSMVKAERSKTRGAYNTLLDLVTALGGDIGNSTLKYMLLTEDDLNLDPKLSQGLADVRAQAGARLG